MQILTLNPTLRSLDIGVFRDGSDSPVLQYLFQKGGDEPLFGPEGEGPEPFSAIPARLEAAGLRSPDIIAVRGLYGGERFDRPVLASDPVLADLAELAWQAPLHVPHLVRVVRAARRTFPRTPVAMVFETAFFVPLPRRERLYGVDPGLAELKSLRRFGFQGILHHGACHNAARTLKGQEKRILSICLEPRPELAACRGVRPVMVTGGSTPVEGLPGETTCGDLDPSVVLKLADDGGGPEATGRLLTSESGLRGLAGRSVTLAEVLEGTDSRLHLARDVFRHCLLRAYGAGVAALGGLDAIVYSGRYAASSGPLHDWLNGRIGQTLGSDTARLVHSRTLAQHLRDIAYAMARQDALQAAAV
ncbi:MAG: hypothetical protein ACYC6Y_16705 [Thermoguttaceae bacterium]